VHPNVTARQATSSTTAIRQHHKIKATDLTGLDSSSIAMHRATNATEVYKNVNNKYDS